MSTIELLTTADGSHTLYLPDLKEQYHSLNGALAESNCIYITAGLDFMAKEKDEIRIFEMGFGTGLNALLSLDFAIRNRKMIHYTGIEAFPIDLDLVSKLNYPELLKNKDLLISFQKMHQLHENEERFFDEQFSFKKILGDIRTYAFKNEEYDLIYFDAFAPKIQEDIWSEEVFRKIFLSCSEGGVLLTYSAAGRVKRNLISAGFKIEKLPGPHGKREILRAIKA